MKRPTFSWGRSRAARRHDAPSADRTAIDGGEDGPAAERDDWSAELIQQHEQRFLCPGDLTVQAPPKKVLLIGQCFFGHWKTVEIEKRLEVSSELFILGAPDEIPDHVMTTPGQFDFQVVHVPLCVAIPDAYLGAAPHDRELILECFERGKHLVEVYLDAMLKFNKLYGLESYVCNQVAPQAGFHGRFAPRYDLSNVLFFTEEINRHLARLIQGYSNTYLVDIDAIGASLGKKASRDDFYWQSNHGGMVTDAEESLDADRLRPTPSAQALYRSDATPFVHAAWREVIAMHRSLHAMDSVKMVVVDLDDTLWRGLVGDGEGDISGWPGGFCEALLHLKHRGILLAILSKNDETVVRDNWHRILGDRIAMRDFAIRRINYDPKVANMAQILEAVNLLPRNVVFIDDNPVEREAMRAAYPDIRTLGEVPAYLKRILMWSSETQGRSVTAESVERTTMIQAQVERDDSRRLFSRDDFLSGLALTMRIRTISDVADRDFPRAAELIGKTNQFNTSGLKMAHPQAVEHFRQGGVFHVFRAADKHTNYGLVGVLVCSGAAIEQFVMSCRVAGLEVEKAAMAAVLSSLAKDHEVGSARLVPTAVNLLCRDVFAAAGYIRDDTDATFWTRDLTSGLPVVPSHIALTTDGVP